MSRHFSNALFVVFLLFFVMLSPWTAANVHFLGMLLSVSVLMCVLSFWYGRDFWRGRYVAFRALSPVVRWGRLFLYFLCGLVVGGALGVLLLWLLLPSYPLVSFSLEPPLAFLLLGLALELFWRGYVQPSLAASLEVLPQAGLWKNMPFSSRPYLYAALLTALLAALLFLPSLCWPLVLSVLGVHLLFAFLYTFFPSVLPALVVAHATLLFVFAGSFRPSSQIELLHCLTDMLP